jgi:hypothetical protein
MVWQSCCEGCRAVTLRSEARLRAVQDVNVKSGLKWPPRSRHSTSYFLLNSPQHVRYRGYVRVRCNARAETPLEHGTDVNAIGWVKMGEAPSLKDVFDLRRGVEKL